jgi:hypothetical protein
LAPSAHWEEVEQLEPTGREPAAAVTVGIGAPLVAAEVDAAAVDELDALKPLQRPWLHVLKAHWESFLQLAWKLPQTGMSIELTA